MNIILKVINKIISLIFVWKSNYKGNVYISFPAYILGHEFICHKNFISGPGLRIECIDNYKGVRYNPHLFIGNDVRFNYNCHIGCINYIYIGNNCLLEAMF